MTSPWDNFDPEAQRVLRSIIDEAFRPYDQYLAQSQHTETQRRVASSMAQEDAKLAAELSALARKYPEFGLRRLEVLEYAIRHPQHAANLDVAYQQMTGEEEQIRTEAEKVAEQYGGKLDWKEVVQSALDNRQPDLGKAYHALRTSGDPKYADLPVTTADERRDQRRARLEELRYLDGSTVRDEKERLLREEAEDQDAQVLAMARKGHEGDSRKALEGEIGVQQARRERDHAYKLIKGRVRPPDQDEERARMDLDALDIIQGRVSGRQLKARASTTQQSSPRVDRFKDNSAPTFKSREDMDEAALALVHEVGARTGGAQSQPNANSVIEQIASQ